MVMVLRLAPLALVGLEVCNLRFTDSRYTENAHLALMAGEVARLIGPRAGLRFDSWEEALGTLGELAREEPLAVVLDEFQWLVAAQPALDSILVLGGTPQVPS